jgi:hypothetical protein
MQRAISALISVGLVSGMLTGCASTQDVNIVGPLDAGTSVKVHEQGTANVAVTNSPLAVSGTVSVGNLPLDASGAVRVTVPAVQRGTVSLVAQNVDLPANGVVSQAGPFIDTSACRSLTTFVSVAGQRASSVAPQIDLSPDGTTPGFTAGGGTLNRPGPLPSTLNSITLCRGPRRPPSRLFRG